LFYLTERQLRDVIHSVHLFRVLLAYNHNTKQPTFHLFIKPRKQGDDYQQLARILESRHQVRRCRRCPLTRLIIDQLSEPDHLGQVFTYPHHLPPPRDIVSDTVFSCREESPRRLASAPDPPWRDLNTVSRYSTIGPLASASDLRPLRRLVIGLDGHVRMRTRFSLRGRGGDDHSLEELPRGTRPTRR